MRRVRLSCAAIGLRSLDRGGAVAARRMRNLAVEFHELRIIDIGTKARLYGLQIRPVSVARHLHAVREAAREIAHKLGCRRTTAVADPPGWNQLGIRVDGNPRPQVASLFRGGLGEHDVALFGVAERPDFIELYALAREIAERPILIIRKRLAGIL